VYIALLGESDGNRRRMQSSLSLSEDAVVAGMSAAFGWIGPAMVRARVTGLLVEIEITSACQRLLDELEQSAGWLAVFSSEVGMAFFVVERASCRLRWVQPVSPPPFIPWGAGLNLAAQDEESVQLSQLGIDLIVLACVSVFALLICVVGARCAGARPAWSVFGLIVVGAAQLCCDCLFIGHALNYEGSTDLYVLLGTGVVGSVIAASTALAVYALKLAQADIFAAVGSRGRSRDRAVQPRAATGGAARCCGSTAPPTDAAATLTGALALHLLLVASWFDLEVLRALPWRNHKWDGLPERGLLFFCVAIAAAQSTLTLCLEAHFIVTKEPPPEVLSCIALLLGVSSLATLLRVVRPMRPLFCAVPCVAGKVRVSRKQQQTSDTMVKGGDPIFPPPPESARAQRGRPSMMAVRSPAQPHRGGFDDLQRIGIVISSNEEQRLAMKARAATQAAEARGHARAAIEREHRDAALGTAAPQQEASSSMEFLSQRHEAPSDGSIAKMHQQIVNEAVRRREVSSLAIAQVALARQRARGGSMDVVVPAVTSSLSPCDSQREWLSRSEQRPGQRASEAAQEAAAQWLLDKISRATLSASAAAAPSPYVGQDVSENSTVPATRLRAQRLLRARAAGGLRQQRLMRARAAAHRGSGDNSTSGNDSEADRQAQHAPTESRASVMASRSRQLRWLRGEMSPGRRSPARSSARSASGDPGKQRMQPSPLSCRIMSDSADQQGDAGATSSASTTSD